MKPEIIILTCFIALSIALGCDVNDCVSQFCPHDTDVGQCICFDIFTFTNVETCLNDICDSLADANNQILRLSNCCGRPLECDLTIDAWDKVGDEIRSNTLTFPFIPLSRFPECGGFLEDPTPTAIPPTTTPTTFTKPPRQTLPPTATISTPTLGSVTTVGSGSSAGKKSGAEILVSDCKLVLGFIVLGICLLEFS